MSSSEVVSVADVFQANNTAYMVLAYENGQSMMSWLDELRRAPTQAEIDSILLPLLDALEYVHGQGLLHRDIAPDNIIIRPDGSPCLIDFGAARQAVLERSQMMSAVVKGSYSPPEQYSRSGRAQGPWSDIYALAATVYRAIAGFTPQDAPDRQLEDNLRSLEDVAHDPNRYRPGFLRQIDAALCLKPAERPQDVPAWRDTLFKRAATVDIASEQVTKRELEPRSRELELWHGPGSLRLFLAGGILLAMVSIVSLNWYARSNGQRATAEITVRQNELPAQQDQSAETKNAREEPPRVADSSQSTPETATDCGKSCAEQYAVLGSYHHWDSDKLEGTFGAPSRT